jgi:hypothetical protein
MFLAAVTPLTDRSGVNLRSVVSLNKTEYDEDAGSASVGDASRTCLVFLTAGDRALWELNTSFPQRACVSFPLCHSIRGLVRCRASKLCCCQVHHLAIYHPDGTFSFLPKVNVLKRTGIGNVMNAIGNPRTMVTLGPSDRKPSYHGDIWSQ